MELATDQWHFGEPLDPKHSSLAHQQESGQADPEVQEADQRIPRCRIVLHGAWRWGMLILEISLIISSPSSIPIVVTAVRCQRRDRSWQRTHCHNKPIISSIRYHILYRIRYRIRYLEYFIQSCYIVYTENHLRCRKSKTYDIVYDIVYQNLRY